jgi:aspartyl-tRNA(Asn)/glutamyl-tRNA(Gln) amidotransferase subunit B
MTGQDKYEIVIGLEVHAQLQTRTKIFAGEEAAFGGDPNSQVSAVTLALPGVLPKLNKAVVEKAIMMGIACNSHIAEISRFARKNYFYPDLPKGYQISQDKTPICVGGYIEISSEHGAREIRLNRIHMEEDAGKNNHELDPCYSLVDLNRAGVPLIEIVSEPDLRSSDEAYAFLTEVRKLVRYLEICDGNMEEGSMRCDANISIRKFGAEAYGTKVEVKNMNSIRNVKRAIDNEVKRQVDMVERGEKIVQQTRSFNPADGSTFPLRSKEYAHDYRYFPEPDLPPLVIHQHEIKEIRRHMPPLPRELYGKYTEELGLSDYDSRVLTDEKGVALFFLELSGKTANAKDAANWVMGPVKSWLNENTADIAALPVSTEQIAQLIALVEDGRLSKVAAKQVFTGLVAAGNGADALDMAESMNLIQSSDEKELEMWIETVLAAHPGKVDEYRSGKKGLIGLFMGEVMKLSKGKADPKKTNGILRTKLES